MSEKKESKYKVLAGWDDWADIVLILKKGEETSMHRLKGKAWYFAIKTTDFKKAGGEEKFKEVFNKKEELIEKFGSNGDFTLIYCKYTTKNPAVSSIVAKLKKMNIVAYESDLSRTKRYMIDKEVPIADNLNILYFDIETDDSTSKRIEIGRDKILSWAAYDNKGKNWYDDTADEKVLIQNLIKLIDKHDVFIGWNSQKFDLPYILKRMEKHEIKYDWRKRIHLDLMKRCIKLYSYEMDKIDLHGFSLNEVARVFLNEAKIEHKEGIKEMYDNNRELLEKYNRKDAELLLKLDSKLELTKLMINECVWTGTTLNRFFVGELLDNYMLRKSKKLQRYLFSRPTREEAEANKAIHVIGGYVKPPITGLYTDVRIFDFKSLYPSMIVSWNIGQDSINLEKTKLGDAAFNNFVGSDRKIEDVEFKEWFSFLMKQKKKIDPNNECYQTANNNFFRKDTNSFIASLIKELLELRSEMKKKLSGLQPGSPDYGSTRSAQAIVKELANCLHPDTALYVHDLMTDKYITMTIKEISLSTHSFEIQSYNFVSHNMQWNKITHVFQKKYSGHLKKIEYHNSLPIICTPEHRLFCAKFDDMQYLKTNSGKLTPTFTLKHALELPITADVKEYTANSLTATHLNMVNSSASHTTINNEYLDLRKYEYNSIKFAKNPILKLTCAKKRYRGRQCVFTSNSIFNTLVETRYINMHKKCKQTNGRYHRYVKLDSILWTALQQLPINEVLEYEIKASLGSNGHTVPLLWQLTNELMWAFGIYVAEGNSGISTTKSVIGGLKMTNTREEYNIRFENALREIGFKSARLKRNTMGCSLLCAIVGELFNYEFYQTSQNNYTAATKSVPTWVFRQSKDKILSFLEGYADGDGNSKDRDKYIRCTTVSPHLTFQIADLFRYVYNKPVALTTAPPANTNSHTSYRMLMRLSEHSRRIFRRVQNEHSFDTIKNITEFEYSGEIYDIEVENTHNFYIGNILSHNSLYGITADRSSRYFNKNIAESITITGQFLNKASSEVIQQISGFATKYSDTDSCFVPIPGSNEDIDVLTDKVNIQLKKSLNKAFSLTTNIVHLEYEKAYRKMIMVDKKRYSGTMMWLNGQKTNMIFSKGLEDVKKNTIGITKRAMRELSKMITFEDKELEHIKQWLEKLKKDIFDESIPIKKEDITISTRLSKPTYKYATKSAHILLAEKMVEKGLILQPSEEADAWGTRIDYVISEVTPKQIATHIDDFDGKWDRRYYWDTQIYAPIFRILQIVWPAEDWAQYSLAEQERKVRELEKLHKKEENERLAKERVQKRIEREAASKLRKEERVKLIEERAKQKLAKETERIKREEERLKLKKEREEARKKRQEEYDKRKLERDLKKQSKAKQLTLNL